MVMYCVVSTVEPSNFGYTLRWGQLVYDINDDHIQRCLWLEANITLHSARLDQNEHKHCLSRKKN